MSVRKTKDFLQDLESQFGWYAGNAGPEVAELYLDAVESTCSLLGKHPRLGPPGGFSHPRLSHWRFFTVSRPFNKHILFYEVEGEDVILRRVMHGYRDLPRRLNEPPG